MNEHPSLLYYGDNTITSDFPLVLIVGREPQSDQLVSKGMGYYDFSEHPRCAFWNTAYRTMALSDGRPGFDAAALKRECIQRRASPIVFTDGLPICLSDRNRGRQKADRRSTVSQEQVEEHIDAIFNLDIMSRVQLAILCGHRLSEFGIATRLYRSRLEERKIPSLETAFFFPTNSKTIAAQIEQAGGWDDLRLVLREFRCSDSIKSPPAPSLPQRSGHQ